MYLTGKVKSNLDLVLFTLGIAVAFGLSIIAGKLLTPIKGRGFRELKEEMMNNSSSGITNHIGESSEKVALTIGKNFTIFGNILVPMFLLFAASLILLAIIWFLIKSVIRDEDTFLNNILKVSLAGAIAFVSFITLQNVWILLVLTFQLALTVFVIVALVVALVSAFVLSGIKKSHGNSAIRTVIIDSE